MFGLLLLSLLTSLTSPYPTYAMRCQELARNVSGCPRYVLGLSPCEQAHKSMCEMVFSE